MKFIIELIYLPMTAGDQLIESLDEALQRFEQTDPVSCELVKLRYFAGLTLREAAEAMEIPPRSADRIWAYAKAWLLREIQGSGSHHK